MSLLDRIAEARIQEAIDRGELRLAASRRQPMNLLLEDQYRQRLLEKFDEARSG
jgi:hypothetical protein